MVVNFFSPLFLRIPQTNTSPANLLTVPPNMTAFLSVILVTSLSGHYKRRGIFILICASIAIIGYIMLMTTSIPHIQYGGTFLVAAGSFACPPIVMGKS